MRMKRIALIALLVIVLGATSSLAYRFLEAKYLEFRVSHALSSLKACGDNSNPVICGRPFVRELLDTQGPGDLMRYFVAARVPPLQCHYLGHIVGQQAYLKDKNIELLLRTCTMSCDAACIHGAIGEMFAQELGMGQAGDDSGPSLVHVNAEDVKTQVRRLCVEEEACHGVGHVAFQMSGDMREALSLCDSAGDYASSCYNGVVMEYADVLSGRNMREAPDIAYPDEASLRELCTVLPDLVQRRSCFRYFSRIVVDTLVQGGDTRDEAYEGLVKICYAYKDVNNRTACFAGVGSYNSYLILTDQDAAIRVCMALEGRLNRASCFFGEIAVSVSPRQEKLLNYCTILPEDIFKGECYQVIFFYLSKFKTSMDQARAFCGTTNTLCIRGYENHAVQPSVQLARDFGL